MKPATLVTALVTGSALVGAGYYLTRARARDRLALPGNVISLITPSIDLRVAEHILAALQRIPGDEVTLLLHTGGGCVTSCVLIANALRDFRRSTAIVPYLAISGGTIIALSANTLQMGRAAALSAVDPIVFGHRVRHLPADATLPAPNLAFAREYERAIAGYMRTTLAARMPAANPAALDRALALFMGSDAPHEWPIRRDDVVALGLPVLPAEPEWALMVDAERGRW